jgi:hypothetical protein
LENIPSVVWRTSRKNNLRSWPRVVLKKITFKEHPAKGGRPNLKSMYEFTRMLK